MNPRTNVRRRTGLLLAVVLTAVSYVTHAQAIAGSWQGTLPAMATAPSQRVVVKVAKKDDGSLKGTLVFIDRGTDGPPLITVTYTAPDFSFEIGGISYHGKMSADGKTIAGTLLMPTGPETKESHEFTLERAAAETEWTYSGPTLKPMAADADPRFDVATIKESPPDARGGVQFILGRREFKAANCTASELIKIAYFVRGRQVDGGPKWLREQKYDVVAQTDSDIAGQPSEAQTRVMVRKLLEERFGLKVHLTQREFTVYAMVVDKPSPKISKSDAQDKPMMLVGKMDDDGQNTLQFANSTMKEFGDLMMNFIQTHQIVDETGLKGKYDFRITIQRSAFQSSPSVDDLPDPAFVQAIQPLGLKFVLKKEPLEVVAVDQMNMPSAN